MSKNTKSIYLKCNCLCSTLVIDKSNYDGEISYNISIQDSSLYSKENTFWNRIKKAFKILFGKPIYYNDIHIDNPKEFEDFVKDVNNLIHQTTEQ